MNYLDQIQRGVDYIEHNLAHPIAIGAVARESGMSQWHFQRTFKGLTGDTVKDYIRSRRLACALDALLRTDKKIIDVAVEADFDSQESFTRAFKAAFDDTPAQYRRAGRKRPFPPKIKFDRGYLQHIHTGMNTTPDIATRAETRYIGMRTTFFGSDSEKNNMGDKLPPLWGQFLARLKEISNTVAGTCYGIVRQLRESSDELEYFCAIEVSTVGAVPPGMQAITTPASTYARFEHKGAVACIDNTVNYIYSTWLATSGRKHSGGADLEVYGAAYSPSSNESIMHYAVPIN